MTGINPTIALLVYVKILETLQAVVDATKNIEVGYRIIQRNRAKSNFAMQQLIEGGMEVLATTLEKILLKREKE